MCADCPPLDVSVEFGKKSEGIAFIEVTSPGARVEMEFTEPSVAMALAWHLYDIIAATAEADERGETEKFLRRASSPFEDL